MIYRIIWTRRALKQLLRIAKPAQIEIKTAVNTLQNRDAWHNVRHLTDHEYAYRLRVGNYRVFFDADDLNLVIAVMEVKKRDSQTY